MPDPEVTMPDSSTSVSAAPVPMETQSAPPSASLQPPAPAQPQRQIQQPDSMTPDPQPPGAFFKNLSHSFTGAVLGAMAGREKITGYNTDENGKQTPIEAPKTTGDQLRQIARSALLGLAAGANAPRQKSGLASALGGLGAGAEDAVERDKQQDLLMRKQSSDEFERGQKALMNKAANAHTIIETAKLSQQLFDMTEESQQKVASSGLNRLNAAEIAGNKVVARDMSWDDLVKFKQANPDYLKLTPFLTKVMPVEGEQVDAQTGRVNTQKLYSLVDGSKPVELTSDMIADLKAVHFPGAEHLAEGTKVPYDVFSNLHLNYLQQYNEALRDPKNKEVIDATGPDGNPAKAVYNKFLDTTEWLRDPDTGRIMPGKMETEQSRILGPDGKTHLWITTKTGKPVKDLGLAGTASDNEMMRTFGDYSLTGPEYLASIEEPVRTTVKEMTHYDIKPGDLGRGGGGRMGIMSAAGHYDPTFDEKNYNLRYDYLKGYQSSASGDGASRSRTNTAIGHLNMLDAASDALSRNDVPFFNKIANEFGYQAGTSAKVAYDIIARKAAGEAAGAVKGGSGSPTDPDIENSFKPLSSDNGYAQRKSAIRKNYGLLKTQTETLENNFENAMGKGSKEFGRPVLSSENEAILNKWTTPPSVNGQAPAGMIQVQIPGAAPGYIPQDKLAAFQQKHPNAQVVK